MKLSTRYGVFVAAAVFCAAALTFLSSKASAQDDGWQIMRAEYGTRTQHNDVTDILKDLVGRGGVNGRVAVNNQTMGGDPAVGADKHLRIWARNRRNEEREFDYKEGGFVEAGMFTVRRDDRRDDRNDRPINYGDRDRDRDRDRDASAGLLILRAYYGVQGRTVNVTDLLRSRVRDGALSFFVTNRDLGGDPAVGYDKVLIVVYSYQGTETATAVREGNTLSLP
jgi:DnaJ-like protein